MDTAQSKDDASIAFEHEEICFDRRTWSGQDGDHSTT